MLSTTLAHAYASLPAAASGRGKGTTHHTSWPAVLPCARFSSLRIFAEAGRSIRWRGDGVALTWDIPAHSKNQPAIVARYPDVPAGRLDTAESTGQEGFTLSFYCPHGDDEQLAVTFSCYPATCVTAAAYPAPPRLATDDPRTWAVRLIDGFCDQYCSPLVRTLVDERRPRWPEVEVRIEDRIKIRQPPGELVMDLGRVIVSGSALRVR